ncbi:MAG: RHS repeat protein, partial [Hyphomonadaceae bacterium]|nr:RHS repeat protein [Hyphomonadaceae bacterium]
MLGIAMRARISNASTSNVALGRLVRTLAGGAIILAAALIAGASSAQAQSPPPPLAPPPPVFQSVDGNGVDLVSGAFNFSSVDVVIGNPGSGGLAYGRSYIGPGWRDNYVGTINSSGATYTVSVGGSSETFTLASGVFTSVQAQGSTLAFNSGTGLYTYQSSAGAIAIFDTALANGMVFDANVARVTSVTQPSGEQLSFHYKTVTVQSVLARRLQSVTNNLGYQLHFDYSLNSPTLSSQLAAWRTVTNVTGINNAVDYCDPNADACTGLTQTWPNASYAISGYYETVTDTLGRATRYGGVPAGNGLESVRFPSSSSADHIQVAYNGSGQVSFVTHGLDTWHYAYADASGARTTTVTDPLSNARVVVSDIASSQVTSEANELSQTTSYQYDSNNRVTRVTRPEGNYTELSYDGRGNVTQTTEVAKSGSGLSNIVTSASYASTCANPV